MASSGRNQQPVAADPLTGQLTLADWERELAHDAQLTTNAAPSEPSHPPSRTAGTETKTPHVSRPSALDDGLNERHLLTVAEVGRATGLSVNAVYRAIWNGELRASKLRGRLRIRDADVDSWVDAGRLDLEPLAGVDGHARVLRLHGRGPVAGCASYSKRPTDQKGEQADSPRCSLALGREVIQE